MTLGTVVVLALGSGAALLGPVLPAQEVAGVGVAGDVRLGTPAPPPPASDPAASDPAATDPAAEPAADDPGSTTCRPVGPADGTCGATVADDLRRVSAVAANGPDEVVVAGEGRIGLVELPTGDRRWDTRPFTSDTEIGLKVEEGTILALRRGEVVRLDPASGAVRWRWRDPEARDPATAGSPRAWVVDGDVLVLDTRGRLVALDGEDGEQRWRTELRRGSDATRGADGLVTSGDGVALWHPSSPTPRWERAAEGLAPRPTPRGITAVGPVPLLARPGLLDLASGERLDAPGSGPLVLFVAGEVTLVARWPDDRLVLTALGAGGRVVWERTDLDVPCCLANPVLGDAGRVALAPPTSPALVLDTTDGRTVATSRWPDARLEAVAGDVALWREGTELVGVDLATGLARFRGRGSVASLDPLVLSGPSGLVAVAGTDGRTGGGAGAGAGGSGSVEATGVRWVRDDLLAGPELARPVGGRLLAVDAEGALRSHELGGGATRWRTPLRGVLGGAPVRIGEEVAGTVPVSTDRRTVFVELGTGSVTGSFDAVVGNARSAGAWWLTHEHDPTGPTSVAARSVLGTAGWRVPVGADERVWLTPAGAVVSDGTQLSRLHSTTGEVRWRREVTRPPDHVVAAADRLVTVTRAGDDTEVRVLDLDRGTPVRRHRLPGSAAAPVVDEAAGTVAVVARTGRRASLHVVDVADGRRARAPLAADGPVDVVVDGSRAAAAVGGEDPEVVVVDLDAPGPVWRTTRERPATELALDGTDEVIVLDPHGVTRLTDPGVGGRGTPGTPRGVRAPGRRSAAAPAPQVTPLPDARLVVTHPLVVATRAVTVGLHHADPP